MKQYIGKFVVAAAMVLAVSGVARAHDDDDEGKPCSLSTLHGLYVFTASGFNVVGSGPQPKAIVELIQFDGRGTLTVPAVTVHQRCDYAGSSPIKPAIDLFDRIRLYGGAPVYSASGFHGAITYDFFVAFKGSQIQMIQTGPGSPVFQGMAERVSR